MNKKRKRPKAPDIPPVVNSGRPIKSSKPPKSTDKQSSGIRAVVIAVATVFFVLFVCIPLAIRVLNSKRAGLRTQQQILETEMILLEVENALDAIMWARARQERARAEEERANARRRKLGNRMGGDKRSAAVTEEDKEKPSLPEYPKQLSDLEVPGYGPGELVDAWGNEFHYEWREGQRPLISSDGPDGKRGTDDDIESS